MGNVPFDEEYNYQKVSCLKIRSRHHSIWISFRSYDDRIKWFELISAQNNKLLEQNLNARRRSAVAMTATLRDENDLYLPVPAFVPDDYSDVCMDCKIKFSVLCRRHHCYYCGKLCCAKCTKEKCVDVWKLFFEKREEFVRVCDECKVERDEHVKAKENKFMCY